MFCCFLFHKTFWYHIFCPKIQRYLTNCFIFYFVLGGLECVGHTFAYGVYFLFLMDVWMDNKP
jgi:hypothetical protein